MDEQIEEEWSISLRHINPSSPSSRVTNTLPTTRIMDNTAAAQVKFFPPLHEQRRSWALEILRRERVTTV